MECVDTNESGSHSEELHRPGQCESSELQQRWTSQLPWTHLRRPSSQPRE